MSQEQDHQQQAAVAPRSGGGSGWLAASAVVLAGLLIAQLGRVGAPAAAYADVVAMQGGFSAATVEAGSGDILIVLDQRSEALAIYDVFNVSTLRFVGREDLRQMFARARQGAGR
jgi:hypothetical protein